jgi:cytochrome c oxidase subunit 2
VKIPSNIITLILGVALTLISLWYGQNHGLMPVAASKDAVEVDSVFNWMMTVATGLFLIVEGVLLYSVIRFRRRPGDQSDGPPVEGNIPLEIFWTAIPTVIVFFLAIYSFEVYNNLGGLDSTNSRDILTQQATAVPGNSSTKMVAMASPHHHLALGIGPNYGANGGPPPLEVNVKGIQYAWIFTYPETGVISGELHIPVDRPVKLNLEAGDVIHALWVPQLRLKQDVIPGRTSILAFTSNLEGAYPIVCAELCGAYHGGMKSTLYVQSQADFDKWVQENTFAESETPQNTMAMRSPLTNLTTDGEYLAPYAQEMGIEEETLSQLQAHHHEIDRAL